MAMPDKTGLAEGPWLTWYSNGQLLSERNMKQGREHGRQRSWWPNGQLMMEGISFEGSRYKGFKYWSIDGSPTELNLETQSGDQIGGHQGERQIAHPLREQQP